MDHNFKQHCIFSIIPLQMSMKITFSLSITFCLFAISLPGQDINIKEPTYSVQQLQTDLNLLRSNLESSHPNIYLYTPKARIDVVFDSLLLNINRPMTELEFYRHICLLSSIIKDGHSLILPSQVISDFHKANSKFLPFKLIIDDNRLLVDMVYSKQSPIKEKAEILSINHISAANIIADLMSRQVRDGYNLTYPIWILNNYFRAYYSYHFGHPEQYIIQYKNSKDIDTARIQALSMDSIDYYRKLKYPDWSNEKRPNEGLSLQFSADNKYAIVKIKDFHKEVLKHQYKQNFKKLISTYFKIIHDNKPNNLIIDLRDNQGGDIEYGAYLLSFLMNQPFHVLNSYYTVHKSMKHFTLKASSGPCLGIYTPYKRAYKGTLYVITNGGSFSNSGIVAACLKRYKRAIFVGEETGGSNTVLAGNIKYVNLPNTGIQIQIPTKRYLLEDTLNLAGRGTIPDYPFKQSWGYSINQEDLIMKYIIDKIAQEK